MKDQHEKIKGYRSLSRQEIDLMNEFKETAEKVRVVLDHAAHDLYNSGHGADYIAEGQRCLNKATDELQTGFMWAIRSIAQPQTFG